MTEPALAVAACGALYAGMTGLCLSMERHYRQVFGHTPGRPKQRLLHYSGWLLLALALVYSVAAWGWTFGPVLWFGMLAGATGLLVILLSYSERTALALAGIGLLVSLIGPLYPASH
jgi:hypothetical protein